MPPDLARFPEGYAGRTVTPIVIVGTVGHADSIQISGQFAGWPYQIPARIPKIESLLAAGRGRPAELLLYGAKPG